jgi:hypothetical protein
MSFVARTGSKIMRRQSGRFESFSSESVHRSDSVRRSSGTIKVSPYCCPHVSRLFPLTELQRSDSVLADQSGGSPVQVCTTAMSSYITTASVIHFAATGQTRACCVEQHGSGLKTKAFVALRTSFCI